jgi:hypothetical protein
MKVRMRLSAKRIHSKHRHFLAMTCGFFVLLHILVLHPLPISQHATEHVSHFDGASSHVMTSVPVVELASGHHDVACALAEWIIPHAKALGMAILQTLLPMIIVLVALQWTRAFVPRFHIPIPNGPSRQAHLQRFTL